MSKTKIDYNSNINQEIKGKFVAREVKACFSYEMEAILRAGQEGQSDKDYPLPSYDDIENLYYFNTENVIYSIMQEAQFKEKELIEYANNPDTFNRRCKNKPDLEVFLNSLNEEELTELCEEFGIDIEDDKSTPQEIFEWWIITEWLAKKLQDKDEPILDWGNNFYWGRTCTGQAILLDGVISDICEELEILEGQKNDWNKYK